MAENDEYLAIDRGWLCFRSLSTTHLDWSQPLPMSVTPLIHEYPGHKAQVMPKWCWHCMICSSPTVQRTSHLDEPCCLRMASYHEATVALRRIWHVVCCVLLLINLHSYKPWTSVSNLQDCSWMVYCQPVNPCQRWDVAPEMSSLFWCLGSFFSLTIGVHLRCLHGVLLHHIQQGIGVLIRLSVGAVEEGREPSLQGPAESPEHRWHGVVQRFRCEKDGKSEVAEVFVGCHQVFTFDAVNLIPCCLVISQWYHHFLCLCLVLECLSFGQGGLLVMTTMVISWFVVRLPMTESVATYCWTPALGLTLHVKSEPAVPNVTRTTRLHIDVWDTEIYFDSAEGWNAAKGALHANWILCTNSHKEELASLASISSLFNWTILLIYPHPDRCGLCGDDHGCAAVAAVLWVHQIPRRNLDPKRTLTFFIVSCKLNMAKICIFISIHIMF